MAEERGSQMSTNVGGSITVSNPGPTNVWYGQITASEKFHQVKIDRVANGFIVEIGCKKFVGENWEVLAKKLGEYWKDPSAAEKKYCKQK